MNIHALRDLLKELRVHLRRRQRDKWDRSLSFEDELFDRFERAEFLDFGEKTSVYQSSLIFGDVKVGKETWIGPFTILDGSGGLEIGDNCSISSGVQIYTHDAVDKRISNGKASVKREQTTIGNSCYIGPLAVIGKGVNVGNNAVVGALTYVNKSVRPYTIVAGCPAKVIGTIDVHRGGKVEYQFTEKEAREGALAEEVKELRARLLYLEEEIEKCRTE